MILETPEVIITCQEALLLLHFNLKSIHQILLFTQVMLYLQSSTWQHFKETCFPDIFALTFILLRQVKLAESCGPSTKYWPKGMVLVRQIKTVHHLTLIHSFCTFCSHCPYIPFIFSHTLPIPSVCLFTGIDIHVPSFMGQSYMQYIGHRHINYLAPYVGLFFFSIYTK